MGERLTIEQWRGPITSGRVAELLGYGLRVDQVAVMLAVRVTTVRQLAAEAGVLSRPVDGKQGRYPQLRDGDWLQQRRSEGCSIRDLADMIGCSTNAVWRALKRHYVP